MALKAGRVGVAPDQVDEFGKINSEATEGYTKQEADAKFETQTHAASTYETKSDAAAKQPINLSVPISMLDGTKLTVESALQGLNAKSESECTSVVGTEQTNVVVRNNREGFLILELNAVTVDANSVLGVIPEGFRPSHDFSFQCASGQIIRLTTAGNILTLTAITNAGVRSATSYII